MLSVAATGVCPVCYWSFSVSILWAIPQQCANVLKRGTPQLCLFQFCCTLNVLPFAVSEDMKETWMIVVNKCLCSSAVVMGMSTLLTVQISTVWKFFDLCRVHPWNSLSCQGECSEFLTVLLCNFTDPDSRGGVALLAVLLSLVSVQLLRFLLWLYGKIYFQLCHRRLLLIRMFSFICNAPSSFSKPAFSLLLIFISLRLTLLLSDF